MELEAKRKAVLIGGQDEFPLVERVKEVLDRAALGAGGSRSEADVDSVIGYGDFAGCSKDVREELLGFARPWHVRSE